MKSYIALIDLNLKLALRQKSVLFFNYLFPLIFFGVFAQAMHGDSNGAMTQIVTMVVVIGVLGNGLFGAGIRAVQEREANILRRFKVTPITPLPILVAASVVGWILFMPLVVGVFSLAHFGYGMPWPDRPLAIFLFVTLAILAFRAIGMILASVANSMQESQILVQLVYLPMLFLSGATFPTSMFPPWLLIVTGFLPATYLVSGLEGMMLRQESLLANGLAAIALAITVIVGLFISYKLFRWEKEEKIRTASKLWVGAVMLPFLVLGLWQAHTQQNVAKTKMLNRQLARSEIYLIRGARIFIGDGNAIEQGSVLVRNGKIAEVYEGEGPDPKSVKASIIEAAGKTLLPGLIDVHVHLVAPGGFYSDMSKYDPESHILRNLAAYLYNGITAVRSVGDPLDIVLKVRSQVNSGERLGAELYTCGPLFTAPGGHGTEYFKDMPENMRKAAEAQFTRIPTNAAQAHQQVVDLKQSGVDCIKAVLESGGGLSVYNRLDTTMFQAVAQEAHAQNLPLAVHTGDLRDLTDAVSARADSIEHGSFREAIPDSSFQQMLAAKSFYDPTLSIGEAFRDFAAGKTDLLKRSLVQQVGPADLIEETEKEMASPDVAPIRERIAAFPIHLEIGMQNLLHAQKAEIPLVTGSDAGNFLILHGPTVQHEIELWVRAGIPAAVALQAATYNAARLLRQESHIGSIRVGNDADLLLVDGNPLEDISAVERISVVIFKGEQIDRSDLFNQK